MQSMSSTAETMSANPIPLYRSISVACGRTEDGAELSVEGLAVTDMPYQTKKIMVPPMKYDLLYASADRVCSHLDELTRFDLASPVYLADLKHCMRARHQTQPIVFGYIPAPPNELITKQVIGANGYFLKMTTTLCEAYFIWHDMQNNVFLFWAPSTYKIVKAMNSIRWRIVKCIEMQSIQEPAMQEPIANERLARPASARQRSRYERSPAPEPESETDDDMPDLISCGNTPEYEHPEQS